MWGIAGPAGQTPHQSHRNGRVRLSLLPCAGKSPFPNPPQLRAKSPDFHQTNPTGCAPASGVEPAAVPRRLWPLQKSLSCGSSYALTADCRAGFQFWISVFCFSNFCFRLLDDISESALHLAKIPDAAQTEGGGQNDGQLNAGPPEVGLAAQQRPAEAVYHANHRVERVKQPRRNVKSVPVPDFRHAVAGVADGREEETELHDEGHDVAEVAVFHVERAQPQADAEGRTEGEEHEQRECQKSA